MIIQIALLLKLDTDHPHSFLRRGAMAVRWKHLLSIVMLVLFCILCPSAMLKKKKDL